MIEKQEMIVSLVALVSCRVQSQIDAGLNMILVLTKKDANRVKDFSLFIKSILDCNEINKRCGFVEPISSAIVL